MRLILPFVLLGFTFSNVPGQDTAYFQQEVHFQIRVLLDDEKHILHGFESVEYVNRSPDTLRHILFHLWPNAYRDASTAFGRQLLENGRTDFHFSKAEERGFIDSLQFLNNGLPVKALADSLFADIVRIDLAVPLLPGKKTVITTPFRVKIPKVFSRLGHTGQQYQICQWYPKPAVYDRDGWHPMPYLDQGEFFAEFGSMDVQITLPENYVVAATGTLQSVREMKRLDSLVLATAGKNFEPPKEKRKTQPEPEIPSSPGQKTLTYRAQNVHDFAWFAAKNYEVERSSVRLSTGKTVTTWSFFKPNEGHRWKGTTRFIDSAVYYYSEWLGDYPYDHAAAVSGLLSPDAGGMEFPMVAVISAEGSAKMLETVIAHEVGHNWFYGALGFNERDHPWMDEGINSYYEDRYVKERFRQDGLLPEKSSAAARLFDLDYPSFYESYLIYLWQASRRADQSPDLPAAAFTPGNYGAIVYEKMAAAFHYLEGTLGRSVLDSLMSDFYQQWQFRHPAPADLRHYFESATRLELAWFFDGLIGSTGHLDYRLTGREPDIQIGESEYVQLQIRNSGDIKGPFTVSAFRKDSLQKTIPYGGFEGTMPVLFPSGAYDSWRIDGGYYLPEINRKNNYLKSSGILRRMEPLRLQWIGSLDNPKRTQIFFAPLAGFNYYDGFMPGIAFYNSALFPKPVNITVLPQIGLRNGKFTGTGELYLPFFLKSGWVHSVHFTSALRSYSYGTSSLYGDTLNTDLRYLRWAQHLTLKLRSGNPRSSVRQQIRLQSFYVWKETTIPENETGLFNHVAYALSDSRKLNPYSFHSTVEFGTATNNYAKVYAEGTFQLTYPGKKRGFEMRAFGGATLQAGDSDQDFHMAATNGLSDYRFNELMLGRSETTGFYSRQITVANDGGFKVNPYGIQPEIGSSESWMLSVNLKVPAPFFTPLFAFADAAYAPNDFYDLFQYDAGIGITLIHEVCEVYLPLFFSADFRENLLNTPFYDHWAERIIFTLNLNRLNPVEYIRGFSL